METTPFKDAVLPWFDADHLMSKRVGANPGEEGNPVLETGNAYAIMGWRNEATPQDVVEFEKAIIAFEKEPGLPNKKPRSEDLVTHDDLIGLISGSVALKKYGAQFQTEIANYGLKSGWFFSNNGKIEFEAYAKPWYVAFYLMAADRNPGLWMKLILAGSILVDAFTGMNSASNKRIMYLMIKTISNKSLIIDLASKIWWFRIRRVYGSAKRIFVMLKGERHPFSVYCPD